MMNETIKKHIDIIQNMTFTPPVVSVYLEYLHENGLNPTMLNSLLHHGLHERKHNFSAEEHEIMESIKVFVEENEALFNNNESLVIFADKNGVIDYAAFARGYPLFHNDSSIEVYTGFRPNLGILRYMADHYKCHLVIAFDRKRLQLLVVEVGKVVAKKIEVFAFLSHRSKTKPKDFKGMKHVVHEQDNNLNAYIKLILQKTINFMKNQSIDDVIILGHKDIGMKLFKKLPRAIKDITSFKTSEVKIPVNKLLQHAEVYI